VTVQFLPDVKVVAKKIAVKVKDWPGSCYGISDAILKAGYVPGGKLRYGHFLGPIAPGTMFDKCRPLIQHGWLEYQDDDDVQIIVDPTRWVFDGSDPYIYQAPDFDGYYDVGGNAFRAGEMLARPIPEFDPGDDPVKLPEGNPVGAMRQLLGDYDGEMVSVNQIGYIANMPPSFLCGMEREIYQWLESVGHKVFIPFDNWQLVMEG